MEGTETEKKGIKPGKTLPKSQGGKDLIPAGKYLVAINHVEKQLAATGNARLSWRFKIAAGPHENRIIFDDTYLTEDALWKVQSLAAAAGLKEEQTFNPDDAKELIKLFVGKELFITTAVDEYTKDGVKRETRKVTGYDSTEAKVPQPRKDGGAAAGSKDEDIPF